VTSTRSARGEQAGAAGAGSTPSLAAALLEAALRGLGRLRRGEPRGEFDELGRVHAGQPLVGEGGQPLRPGASALVGPQRAHLVGAGGGDGVVPGAVAGVRSDRQPAQLLAGDSQPDRIVARIQLGLHSQPTAGAG